MFEDFGAVIHEMIYNMFLIGRFYRSGCNFHDLGFFMEDSILVIMFDFKKIEFGQISSKTCHESKDLKITRKYRWTSLELE